jgi:hypothetical protein
MYGHASETDNPLPLAIIAAVVAAILLCIGPWPWGARKELMALSSEERASLYQRTLATVRTTCVHANGSELREFCREQGRLLSLFPECDTQCKLDCQQLRPRPTK